LCFERYFREANNQEALCFEVVDRFMRQRNPDKGLKLVGDAAPKDSDAKYFLAMLKYRCNPTDPKAMALLHEISGGPSPPDGRSKNHNLGRLHYLINRDLHNIAWWYWLRDDDGNISLLLVQNPHVCIWAAGCRHHGPETSEIIHYCSAECCNRHEFNLWTRNFSIAVEYVISRMNIGM
jgi:hypothetical protein